METPYIENVFFIAHSRKMREEEKEKWSIRAVNRAKP